MVTYNSELLNTVGRCGYFNCTCKLSPCTLTDFFQFSDNFEITTVPDRIMTEEWTNPVRGLWQHLLLDFGAEQDFNVKISQKLPHCSICALFKPLHVSLSSIYAFHLLALLLLKII